MNKKNLSKIMKSQTFFLICIIVILVVFITLVNPRFIMKQNILAILQQISVLGIATMATTMLLKSAITQPIPENVAIYEEYYQIFRDTFPQFSRNLQRLTNLGRSGS